jgi:hypothetical protein
MRRLLGRFFDHAASVTSPFDYRDCSLGNLVFAGAYLERGNDFNAAAAEIADLVGSRARLLNVGEQQNRVLVALKQDGAFLSSEAEIVSPQSAAPIANLYLLEHPLTDDEKRDLSRLDHAEKQAFLAERDNVPNLSVPAMLMLRDADVILYGPGTQHSSLLPSYRIAAKALADAPASIKALVLNLDGDNDIQGLSAADLVDRALTYGATVTHILSDPAARLSAGALTGETYRGAKILRGTHATAARPHVHNGGVVADIVRALRAARAIPPAIEVFADIHNRSVARDELVEEFLETNWSGSAHLTLNRIAPDLSGIPVSVAQYDGLFPEAAFFRDWLRNGDAEYLVLMTGDGAYDFRDVQNIIRLLEQQSSLGGVFGSRTQSRKQFITSVRAAYGEHRFLYWLGKAAAFLLSTIFYLRTGVIFSDPLTGLRVFRRHSLLRLPPGSIREGDTPLAIVRQLIRQGVEVAELPVLYRTFSGFTDPHWRVRRGLRNLLSLI